jgi:hypothetical protein
MNLKAYATLSCLEQGWAEKYRSWKISVHSMAFVVYANIYFLLRIYQL